MPAWDAQTASYVVQAYNLLSGSRVGSDVMESAELVVLASLKQHVVDKDAHDTATVSLSLAHHSRVFSSICEQLQDRVSSVAGSMNAQEVTDTMWAFASR